MNILVIGGTGFIGQALIQNLLRKGHEVTVVSRNVESIHKIFSKRVYAASLQEITETHGVIYQDMDVVFNLAGTNIGDKRWTKARKKEIYNSRILVTREAAKFCALEGKKSLQLFNASAVGVYGLQDSVDHGLPPAFDESAHIDLHHFHDFLSKIGREWEQATEPVKLAGQRVVNMRFGVVLGRHGGVLQKLKVPFEFGLGGVIGNGHQPFSWIALEDVVRAIDFIFDKPEISGPINFVAPYAVTQRELAYALGKALHRPSRMHTPSFVLKLVFGQMADELLLKGQHVIPKRLLELGFEFRYPKIQEALNAIFAGKTF